jgi:UDP-N-acetylmuramyl pentapeptide phosphotransferase/UDP-N-acetylglucosamine-1-phosphate transferase
LVSKHKEKPLNSPETIFWVEPFIAAFLFCLVLTPAVIRFASTRRLFDVPDDRKIHTAEIPRLGGVAIMGALLISTLLIAGADTLIHLRYFLAGLLILFFVGLWDDMQPVSPFVKLLGESIPIILMSWFNRIPLHELAPASEWLLTMELPATIFLSFWIVNAFNLIDGINGLAGCIGLIALCGMGIMGEPDVYHLSFAFAGALLAFLFFNFFRPKIFMGDCGSLPIGYTLAFGMTQLSFHNHVDNNAVFLKEPIIAFSLMIVPLFDMVRVFVIRIQRGKNPFKGDRNHLHHMLLEIGLSHVGATIQLVMLSIITTCISIFTLHFLEAENYLVYILLTLPLPAFAFTALLWRRVKNIRRSKL